MRGTLFIVILIAMLIAAYLVVKNMESVTDSTSDVEKIEAIDRAKDVAEEAGKVNDLLKKRTGDAVP